VKQTRYSILKAIALLTIVANMAVGQKLLAVSGSASCSKCSITVNAFVENGGTDGDGALPIAQPLVARDQRGRIYAYGGGIEGVIVYDSAGTFLRRIGRAGSGPGEFRGVSGVVGIGGDSVAVIDATLRRMTVLDPRFVIARTVSISEGFGAARQVGGGTILVNAPDARRRPPVATIAVSTGNTLHTFGAFDLMVPEGSLRAIAVDTGGIWIAYATRYRIERWSNDGQFFFCVGTASQLVRRTD
jgi:hypothetical protein